MEKSDIIKYLTDKEEILRIHYDRILGFREYLDNEDNLISAVVFSDISLSDTYVSSSHEKDRMSSILRQKEKMKADIEKEYYEELYLFEQEQQMIDRVNTCMEILDEGVYEIVKDAVINNLPIKAIEMKYNITKPTVIKKREKGLNKILELAESGYTLAELKIMAAGNVGRRKAFAE